jgi:hypothetical protein
MKTKKTISILSRVVLGALLVGVPTSVAFAGEPEVTTAESAEVMAQHYREQADHYRSLGGVGWKTGLVQRADADAAKYTALAEQLRAPAAGAPVRSAEAQHYADLAAQYRAMGGVGYKSGLVQSAEAQQAKYEAPATAAPTTSEPTPASCAATKPAVAFTLACAR